MTIESATFNETIVFCDGACSGNPGPGGWGTIVATMDGHVRELGGGNPQTTNNQMEMRAALEALLFLAGKPGDVAIHTDSVYVIRGITQWIWGWMRNGWRTGEGKDVSNRELWQALAGAVADRKKLGRLDWRYVRGHTGIPGNERCDEIAVQFAARRTPHLYDGPLLGYGIAIFDLPANTGLPEMKDRKGEKKAAHSYLSLLGGTPMRHATWADCERRVKGQPGAKFKKAQSAEDENVILNSWGVDPARLKS